MEPSYQTEQEPLDDLRRITDEIAVLERELGLPESFCVGLWSSEPSDWAFIIKGSAVLEAAVLHILREQQIPALQAVVKELNRKARLKCLKHLQVLDDRDVAFILAVNELRDQYAHQVASANATILEILDQKTPNDRLRRMRDLAFFQSDLELFR